MNFISDNLGKIVCTIIVAAIAFNISLYFFASCDSVGWLPTREIFEPIQGRLEPLDMLETPEAPHTHGLPTTLDNFSPKAIQLFTASFPLHSDSVGLEST